MDVAPGIVIAGKFRLERALARGGMGSVWVARHLQLDTEVAVKFMATELASSSSARVRFEREARASALIKSPHVVQVLDYGVEGDTPYIAMELLEGESLSARIRREKRLPLPVVAAILEPLCRGLRRAHEAGIVHRDLKPGNVFLVRQHEGEIVKVLDFGVAKALVKQTSGDTTSTGSLVGSPYYMSPEQVRHAKEVDARSDLWAVGVIAYQLLTGTLPFSSTEIGAVLVAICTEPFPPASSVVPGLGPEVDRFFDRALARAPADRFQSARALSDAFSELAGTPRPLRSGVFTPLPDSMRPPEPEPAASGEMGSLSPAGHSHAATTGGARRGVLLGVAAVAAAVLIAGVTWQVTRVQAAASAGSPVSLPLGAQSPSLATASVPPTVVVAPVMALDAPPLSSATSTAPSASAAPPAKPRGAPGIAPRSAPRDTSDVQKRIGL